MFWSALPHLGQELIRVVDEITDERVAVIVLKNDCRSCTRCAIGGKTLSGSEWSSEPDDDGEVQPITNVFSNMNFSAEVMVVGQNPGADEVAAAEPFVGTSGKVFNQVLRDIVGLERKDLYITNTVKCYTARNRKPTQGEMDNCRDCLDLEMKLVEPRVVVALGSHAFKTLTGMSGIMKNSGMMVMSPRYRVPVLAMLHPSPYNTTHPERRKLFDKAMYTLKAYMVGLERSKQHTS